MADDLTCGSCGSPDLDTDPERLSGTEIQRLRSPPLTGKTTSPAVAIPMFTGLVFLL